MALRIVRIIDIDMTCRAGTTAPAKCEKLVDPCVPDRFHHGNAAIEIDDLCLGLARYDRQLRHSGNLSRS